MSLTLQEQYDKIYKYCYFKVKNAHLAEDLTQETFLRYFSQNSYINRGKQLAYLYTIAMNLCTEEYRKTDKRPLSEDAAAENAEINALETSIAVRQAVDALPGNIQEILLLRYSNELSMKEICEITGLSRFAIARRINNGLRLLRKLLREDGFL